LCLKKEKKSEVGKNSTLKKLKILTDHKTFFAWSKKANKVDETCSTNGRDQTCTIVETLSRTSLKLFRPEFPKCTRDCSPKCQNRLCSSPASYSVGTGSKAAGA
jgi:hypothetical protein